MESTISAARGSRTRSLALRDSSARAYNGTSSVSCAWPSSIPPFLSMPSSSGLPAAGGRSPARVPDAGPHRRGHRSAGVVLDDQLLVTGHGHVGTGRLGEQHGLQVGHAGVQVGRQDSGGVRAGGGRLEWGLGAARLADGEAFTNPEGAPVLPLYLRRPDAQVPAGYKAVLRA